MKTRNFFFALAVLSAGAALSACGGGGAHSEFAPPPAYNILSDDSQAEETPQVNHLPPAVQAAAAKALNAAFGQQSSNPPAAVVAGYHSPFSQSIAEDATFTVGGQSYDILQVTDGDGGAKIYTVQSPREILQHKCDAADWCVGFTAKAGQAEMVRITAPGAMEGQMVPRWQTTTGRRCRIQGGSEICQEEIGFNEHPTNSPRGRAVHRRVWTCNGDSCQGPMNAPAEMEVNPLESPPADFTAAASGAGASGQVALTWTAVEGVSGYKIYRNGELIETLADGAATSYTDNPGIGDYQYTIAAYTDDGDSPQTTAQTANIGKAVGVAAPATDAIISVADIEADYGAKAQTENADANNTNTLRPGLESANVPVVVDEYTDANDIPVVHIQRLSYAHLGLWLIDNTFDDDNDGDNWQSSGTSDADDDGLQIVYHLLNDNRIVGRANLPTENTATYELEGDIVYKGERFYPDNDNRGDLSADFGAGTVSGRISLDDDTPDRNNYFGGNTFGSGATPPIFSLIDLRFENGSINADGAFSGDVRVSTSLGFFGDLNGRNSANANIEGGFSGAFFDAADYDQSTDGTPAEVGGVFSLEDSNGETLTGGFLGAER